MDNVIFDRNDTRLAVKEILVWNSVLVELQIFNKYLWQIDIAIGISLDF